jgi:hypothetical protein
MSGASSVGTEITFLDCKRVVDNWMVPLIREATNGAPERFTYKDAMARSGGAAMKQHLRSVQQSVIREHFGL